MYIEAVFNFPELTVEGATTTAIPSFFKYFVVDEPGSPPYLSIRLESSFTKDDSLEGAIETGYYFIKSSEREKTISESARIRAERSILSNIKCLYVPALRNPSDQLKSVSGTILYRLLNSVEWLPKKTTELQGLIESINTTLNSVPGVVNLQSILQEQWSGYHKDTRYANAKIEFSSTDLDSTLKTAGIKFAPTEVPRDYDVSELGDGLRSLFYFTLVNTLLKVERNALDSIEKGDAPLQSQKSLPPVLTILAVEEPEKHIAPQLLGRVILHLKETAVASNAQVVLSSHTPAIVKRIEATSIRYFRLDTARQSSVVSEITLPAKEDDAYKYEKEAIEAYPEVYFARLVVLGEGDSEIVVLPRIMDRLKKNIDVLGITVAPLGGRHVNHFWKLLNHLNIPHITLLDLDNERYGGGWGRIKYALKQLIENGVDKNTLLKLSDDRVLSDEELDQMHQCKVVNVTDMSGWLALLQRYNVYFSSPLDLDYLLLENYPDCILSCLMEKPMHGYELGKTLKRTFSVCTRISNNTIYPTLKKFQTRGYITKREKPQKGKPDRFVYEITEAGKRGFIQTLNTVTDVLAFDREEFFVRVSFFHLLTPDTRKKVLENRLAFIRETVLTAQTLQDEESPYSHRSEEGREFLLALYRLEVETIAKFQCRIDEPCLAPKEYLQ